MTVLLTTRYLEEADRIALVNHGHVIAEGTATELKEQVSQHRLGPDDERRHQVRLRMHGRG